MGIRLLDVINLQKQSRAQKTFQTTSTAKNDRFSRQNIEILVRSWFFRFLVLEFILPVLAAQEELRVQILRVFCLRKTLYNFGFYFGKSHVEFWLLVSSGTDKIGGEWTTECQQEKTKIESATSANYLTASGYSNAFRNCFQNFHTINILGGDRILTFHHDYSVGNRTNHHFWAISRPKSNRWLLKIISPRQVAKKLLETGLSCHIASISWEEIEL